MWSAPGLKSNTSGRVTSFALNRMTALPVIGAVGATGIAKAKSQRSASIDCARSVAKARDTPGSGSAGSVILSFPWQPGSKVIKPRKTPHRRVERVGNAEKPAGQESASFSDILPVQDYHSRD